MELQICESHTRLKLTERGVALLTALIENGMTLQEVAARFAKS